MKTHNLWPLRRFADLSRDAIDTRPVVTNGCDQQGRYPMEAASSCTEIGADGVPSVWESADKEVALILAKAVGAMLAFASLVWMLQP